MPNRVLDGEILDQRFELVGQRVIGGAHVGELGVAAFRWDFMAQQQRISRAVGMKRHIRVPEPVALAEQHAAIVRLHDVAVGVEIADVDQGRIVDALLVAGDLEHGPHFDWSEQAAEGDMLFIGGRPLVTKHDDTMAMDRVMEVAHRLPLRRSGKINAGDFGREHGMKRIDVHGVSSDLPSICGSYHSA